jgi:hypothetical protein
MPGEIDASSESTPAVPAAASSLLDDLAATPDADGTGAAGAPTDAGNADATADGTKPEGEDGADKPAEGDKKDASAGAPEEYADFTLPEGVQLAGPVADEFKALAKEHNLSQEAAQKFADLGAKQAQALAAGQQEILVKARAEWAERSRTDPEFGSADEKQLKQNLSVALKAREQFASPELVEMLKESGLTNHPDVIRLFYRVGKAITPDGFVGGRQAAGAPKTDADVFYGSTPAT